nr:immunoglobulin light chain junction region [Macaca mulatta]
CQQRSDFPQTF